MHNFQELKLWNKAMDVAVETYKLTSTFPIEEKYGLTSQIRRSAISVPSNIAEGAGRNTDGEFLNFLGIANGSSYELQTQLILSYRLDLTSEAEVEPILNDLTEVQKMNFVFMNNLKNKNL